MQPDESPEVIELYNRIASLFPDARGFSGVIFRSVAVKYASAKHFFSGGGAAKSGGRWNPSGMKAIYASLDVITATHEAYQNFLHFGFPTIAIEPRVMAGAAVSLSKILDLTDAKIRRQLGFTLKDLVTEDWRAIQDRGQESWTQTIGRCAKQAGFDGMIVPSARTKDGHNIVIFHDATTKNVKIKILAPHKLPK